MPLCVPPRCADGGPFEHLPNIVEQMPAIRHLHRLGCRLGRGIPIVLAAITADDGTAGMGGEPGCEGLLVAATEQIDWTPTLQIDQDGAVPKRANYNCSTKVK